MLVPIDKLEPGLKVARDVVNVNGMVLLAAGVELASQHLRTLKMWGIDAVQVEGEEAGGAPERLDSAISPAVEQAAQTRVNQRLKHVPADDPASAYLRLMAVRRTAARLAGQESTSGVKA